ncbi:MAG: hypothetical protein LBV21_04125 [Candidatus Adiutrix sp.]|jgi:hypothetical protein|nr:hypothetical protein [Candidatus Adiutrix sp.]
MAALTETEATPGQARDRALTYVRGLGLAPIPGLKLVLAALEGAGTDSLAAVMDELQTLLRQEGLHPERPAVAPAAAPATPPIHRRPLAAAK